jgi:hypothetical protein
MTGMRIAMLLLGAVLAWGGAPAEAWAQRQEARPASAGKAQASPQRAAAPRREAARPAATAPRQAANRATATRAATTRVATQRSTQAAACARRDSRGRCVQQVGPRTVAWQGGLPAASGEQAVTCPTGTIATLARGHSDVVRCLPI